MRKNNTIGFTIEEMADCFEIPQLTLYTLVREGKIPSRRIGRNRRSRKQAINHFPLLIKPIRTDITPTYVRT